MPIFKGLFVFLHGSLKDIGHGLTKFIERRRYFTKDEIIEIMETGNLNDQLLSTKIGKDGIEFSYKRD